MSNRFFGSRFLDFTEIPKLWLALVVFLLSFSANAQFYSVGENPASICWRQIRSPHFTIIYPADFEQEAKRVTSTLELNYSYGSYSLGGQPKRFPIILQTQLSSSNGFVTLAPRRSEFFTVMPQDQEPVDWLNQLAIHEFRHMVQVDKYRQGFSNVPYWLLGEQGTGLVFGATTPLWFMEGDATLNETSLTLSGRGRMPEFVMSYRTQLLERGPYTYDKASFGSFRDVIPNQYPFGYHMVAYARRHYGEDVWGKTLDKIARWPIRFFPFSRCLKKVTGLTTSELYRRTVQELDSLWREQDSLISPTPYQALNHRTSKVPTFYRHPIAMPDGRVLVLKYGYGMIDAFVLVDSLGNEEKVFEPGPYDRISLSSDGKSIVWAEEHPDPRWGYRSFSVVLRYDLAEKKRYELSRKSRLYAPAISMDGEKVVAVEVDELNHSSVVILNAKSGKQLKKMGESDSIFYKMPWFSSDGKKVVVVKFVRGLGNTLAVFDANSGQADGDLLAYSRFQVANPTWSGDTVCYRSSASGIDNVFGVVVSTREVFQLTSSRFGAYDPFMHQGQLFYADYRTEGFDLVRAEKDSLLYSPEGPSNFVAYYEPAERQELKPNVLDSIPQLDLESKKYRKIGHLLNFHSWQPVAMDPNDYSTTIGVEVKSQNVLSTAILGGRWGYDGVNDINTLSAELSYRGWYPVLDFGVEREQQSNFNRFVLSGDDTLEVTDRREVDYDFSVSLPLNFTKGKHFVFFTPILSASYEDILFTGPQFRSQFEWTPLRGHLIFRRVRKRAVRDILSPWEQYLRFSIAKAPFNDGQEELYYATGRFNFPGLFKHQVLRVRLGGQYIGGERLRFRRGYLNFPRGVKEEDTDHLATLQVDYTFPIAYPDLRVWWLAYFQRINASPFYDYSWSTYLGNHKNFESFGLELTTDANFLRYGYLLSVGARFSYVTKEQNPVFEGIFGISFY